MPISSLYGPFNSSKRLLFSSLTSLLLLLISCGDGPETASTPDKGSETAASADVPVPPYTVVKSDLDGKDNIYRVQVGDELPNEQESIALARKVTQIENTTSVNTAVYITRHGYSTLADAHASVTFLKSEDKPSYLLLSSNNERLKEIADLKFDSIPDKKLIVECLEAAGSKEFIFQKPGGAYFRVTMFSEKGYEIEPLKGDKDGRVFTKTEDGETFTFKLNDTDETIEVYNGNNTLYNSWKVLRKG